MKEEMQRVRKLAGIVLLLSLLVLMAIPSASFSGYDIPADVLDGGGGEGNSASYRIVDSVGQSVIGDGQSVSYKEYIGYWHMLGSRVLPYIISGCVVRRDGVAVPDVVLELSGDAAAFDTTDNDGCYEFTGLSEGEYTVTPSRSDAIGEWTCAPHHME